MTPDELMAVAQAAVVVMLFVVSGAIIHIIW